MTDTLSRPSEAARPLRRVGDRLVQLAEAATTPLLPEDYLDLFHPLRRGAALRGKVVEVVPETRDAATLVIRPGADWAGHVPGQYVRVGIDVDGVREWRAYSLTPGPPPAGNSPTRGKPGPAGKASHPPGTPPRQGPPLPPS